MAATKTKTQPAAAKPTKATAASATRAKRPAVPTAMPTSFIAIGTWFPRTILHLSEVADFLQTGKSPMQLLDADKLQALHAGMELHSHSRHYEEMEYLLLQASSGVQVRIYEDGLTLLSHPLSAANDTAAIIRLLRHYYEEQLSPAIGYLFSLGAPIPKELANIKTIYPFFICVDNDADRKTAMSQAAPDATEWQEIDQGNMRIALADKVYIMQHRGEAAGTLRSYVEHHIIVREFQSQLHRYLYIHRTIWEKIDSVKEAGNIRGNNVGDFLTQLEDYQKTIELIEARINQMSLFIQSRKAMLQRDDDMQPYSTVLLLKYDNLRSANDYIKEVWRMTKNYLQASIKTFGGIRDEAGNSGIDNLTFVTSVGVGASLIGLFTNEIPSISWTNLPYVVALAAVGWATSRLLGWLAARRRYSIDGLDIKTDIR